MQDGAGRLRVGLRLPTMEGELAGGRTASWTDLRAMARAAEAAGFDSLWVCDHFIYRDDPPLVTLPEGETRGFFECWTVLSALAEATERIQLGTLVTCTAYRNPALLAKLAETLDEVSGGRLILGLGAGWFLPEFAAFGYPGDHRVSRFEEALKIIVPLLRTGRADFAGRYYQAKACELRPRGPREGSGGAGVPVMVGAMGPRMLNLAARFGDAFNTGFPKDAADLAARFAELDAACRAIGRDPAAVERTVEVRIWPDAPADLPPQDLPTIGGTPEQIAEGMFALHRAGAQHLMWHLAVYPPDASGIERLGRAVAALRQLAAARS